MTTPPETPPKTPPKKKSKLSTRLGFIFLVLAALWIFTILTRENLVPVGQAAPDWQLKVAGKSGEKLALGDLKGKVVVLDFWSLGCPPCMTEASVLESVWRQMENQGVTVLGVSAWGESEGDVLGFKKNKSLTYPMLLGTAKMVANYKVSSLPTLYIIGKDGQVAATHQGFWSKDGIIETVSKVLGRE